MSTRGMIARPRGDGFEGVYHHWDSYPEGLGKTLWNLCQERKDDLAGVVKLLIDDHRAGWSTINGADWSLEPGYSNFNPQTFERESNRPQCYCHGDRAEEPLPLMTESDADWLFIEWAYVIDAESRRFTVVLGCVREPGSSEVDLGGGRTYEQNNYGFRLLAGFSLDDEEPNWAALKELGYQMRDEARAACGEKVDVESTPA